MPAAIADEELGEEAVFEVVLGPARADEVLGAVVEDDLPPDAAELDEPVEVTEAAPELVVLDVTEGAGDVNYHSRQKTAIITSYMQIRCLERE